MMISLSSLLSALVVTFFFQRCLSADVGVQVDLIFPRNNTIYQPVFPFPFIFAVHNFSTAWPYRPLLTWRLIQLKSATQDRAFGATGEIGWDAFHGRQNWGAPADKFLAINSTDAISQYNESNWRLEYVFKLGEDECFAGIEGKNPAASHGSLGVIYFNTSNITGVMPDITASSPCAVPLAALGFAGQNQTNATCPLLSSPNPTPIPCAFSVDKQVADQVAKEMVTRSNCNGVTWPNGTGIGTQCNTSKTGKKSIANSSPLQWNLFVAALPILLMALWSSVV
jgi:hypothetical protein